MSEDVFKSEVLRAATREARERLEPMRRVVQARTHQAPPDVVERAIKLEANYQTLLYREREASKSMAAALDSCSWSFGEQSFDSRLVEEALEKYAALFSTQRNNPVQDAKPVTEKAEVQGEPAGRTAGANPATGATPQTISENEAVEVMAKSIVLDKDQWENAADIMRVAYRALLSAGALPTKPSNERVRENAEADYQGALADINALVAAFRKRMPDDEWLNLNYPLPASHDQEGV